MGTSHCAREFPDNKAVFVTGITCQLEEVGITIVSTWGMKQWVWESWSYPKVIKAQLLVIELEFTTPQLRTSDPVPDVFSPW